MSILVKLFWSQNIKSSESYIFLTSAAAKRNILFKPTSFQRNDWKPTAFETPRERNTVFIFAEVNERSQLRVTK